MRRPRPRPGDRQLPKPERRVDLLGRLYSICDMAVAKVQRLRAGLKRAKGVQN